MTAHGVLEVVAGIGAVLAIGGMCWMLLAMSFNRDGSDLPMRVSAVGLTVMLAAGVAWMVTDTPSPLSRGIVGNKRVRSYTTTILVGKVPVIQQHRAWELISTEGAVCRVVPASYERYHLGDAVVCSWWAP